MKPKELATRRISERPMAKLKRYAQVTIHPGTYPR